jgi:teichuronic acid biosynthesis glycosyltransferase TuaG
MISILMPIYNGIEFINESIDSIIKQTYTDWELIIGINGHPKDSYEYNKALTFASDKITVLDLYMCNGKSNTLNNMVKFAKYNYIALLDVDDKWTDNKLMIQMQYIDKYDVVGTNFIYFGESHGSPKITLGDLTNYNFLKCNPIGNSSVIIKKDLGYWDPIWDGLEDYNLWLKLNKMNKTFYNCHDILMHHRIHKKSAFNNTNNNNIGKLLEKYRNS